GEAFGFERIGAEAALVDGLYGLKMFGQHRHDYRVMDAAAGCPQNGWWLGHGLGRHGNCPYGNRTQCGSAVFHTEAGNVDMIELETIGRLRQWALEIIGG